MEFRKYAQKNFIVGFGSIVFDFGSDQSISWHPVVLRCERDGFWRSKYSPWDVWMNR